MIAVVGVIGGIVFGVMSYRDAQRHSDTLDHVATGAMTVDLLTAADRVIYVEDAKGLSART